MAGSDGPMRSGRILDDSVDFIDRIHLGETPAEADAGGKLSMQTAGISRGIGRSTLTIGPRREDQRPG